MAVEIEHYPADDGLIYNYQRKVIYAQGYYYVFYINSDGYIAWKFSSDKTNWTDGYISGSTVSNFSVCNDGSYIHIAMVKSDLSGVYYRRAEIQSDGTLIFSTTNWVQIEATPRTEYYRISVTTDSNSHVWVLFVGYSSALDNYYPEAIENTDTTGDWNSGVSQSFGNGVSNWQSITILGFDNGHVAVAGFQGTSRDLYVYDGSNWNEKISYFQAYAVDTSLSGWSVGNVAYFSYGVNDTSSGTKKLVITKYDDSADTHTDLYDQTTSDAPSYTSISVFSSKMIAMYLYGSSTDENLKYIISSDNGTTWQSKELSGVNVHNYYNFSLQPDGNCYLWQDENLSTYPVYFDCTPIGQAYTKTLTETITLTDSIKKLPSKKLKESITLADTFSKQWAIIRYLTESISLSDTIRKDVKKYLRDSIALNDFVRKGMNKRLFESLTLSDSLSHVWHIYRRLYESLNLSDRLSKHPSKQLRENISLVDTFSRVWGAHKTLTETITLSDRLLKSPSKMLKENIRLSDHLAWLYPYYNPEISLEKLINAARLLDKIGIPLEEALDDPYLVYLMRYMAKREKGEL